MPIGRDHRLLDGGRNARATQDGLIARGIDDGCASKVAIELGWIHSGLAFRILRKIPEISTLPCPMYDTATYSSDQQVIDKPVRPT
jgi:hypothetical protein